MSDVLTAKFKGWGYRELGMAAELLDTYSDHPVQWLDGDTLTVNFNLNSGIVFLSDEEYAVGVLEEGATKEKNRIVQLFNCPQCGYENTQKGALVEGKDFEKYDGYCSAECAGEDEE